MAWAQQTYLKEPLHRTKKGDSFWRASKSAAPQDYAFVGITEGMFADLTCVMQGQLFVAVADAHKLALSYKKMNGSDAADLTALCGHLTQNSISELQASLPEDGPWVFWQVMDAGQMLMTPPGHVRAEGISMVINLLRIHDSIKLCLCLCVFSCVCPLLAGCVSLLVNLLSQVWLQLRHVVCAGRCLQEHS